MARRVLEPQLLRRFGECGSERGTAEVGVPRQAAVLTPCVAQVDGIRGRSSGALIAGTRSCRAKQHMENLGVRFTFDRRVEHHGLSPRHARLRFEDWDGGISNS